MVKKITYLPLIVICLLLAACINVSASAWQPPKPTTMEGWVKEGNDYFAKSNWCYAILSYSSAIELSPGNSEVYYKRSRAYYNLGYDLLAQKDIDRAIKMNPKFADAYFLRGSISKDDSQALRDFSKAIELNKNLAQAYHFRGIVYNRKGKYDPAIADFSKVIELKPDGYIAGAYRMRGRLYGLTGKYKQAVNDLTEAIQLYTDSIDSAYFNLAQAYDLSGNKTEAIKYYKIALKFEQPNTAKLKIEARLNGDWNSYHDWL